MDSSVKRYNRVRLFVRFRLILAFSLCAAALSGCRTGPLADFYAYNPLNRQGPEESEYGPAPAVRRQQVQQLAKRIRKMPPTEQIAMAADLSLQMQNEVDPIVRADIVRALGKVNTQATQQSLNMAMHDAEACVRLAACEAWREVGGQEAVAALSEMIASDTDNDVRLEATRALGAFNDPAAVRGLSVALDDANAALQYRAMESLKQVSGQELGYDVVAWRNYVDATAPAESPREGPTLVERFQDRF